MQPKALTTKHLVQGDTKAAVREMEAAHALEPASEVFSRWLARAYAYADRPKDALNMATETLRIRNDDEAAMLVRACAQEELGDLRDALKTLRAIGARNAAELPFVVPDEARIEALLDRDARRALIGRVDRAVATSRADAFEASLFYLTVGLDDRAYALLRATPAPLAMVGIEANDPRYKRFSSYRWWLARISDR